MLGDRVLVKAIHQQEHTHASGIISLESHAPDVIGTVEQIGSDVQSPDFAVGDTVMFPPSAGQEAAYDGETYIALEVDDILAVFDEQES